MRRLKRIAVYVVLVVVCYLLETTVFPHLALASVIPNTLVIVTSSIGFMRGKKEGMIT